MPDYGSLRATAASLITSFGSGLKATVMRTVPGVYDPLSDSDAAQTLQVFDPLVVTLPIGEDDRSVGPGGLAVTYDAKVYFPSTFEPMVGDSVVLPGVPGVFAVKAVSTNAPDGAAVYHKAMLARLT